MPDPIFAESFFARYDHELTAVASLIIAALAVVVVNRSLTRRGRTLATAVSGGELRPEIDTRLRFLRRIVDVVIVVIGVAVAMSQFTAVGEVASAVLTSGAIAAAVIGFAARQTLANAIAGILIAITQPLRIGDVVTFEGETGTVEDVRLTYTWLRTPADARIIVPNERLAAGVLRNDSIVDATVSVEASIWVHREIEPVAAVDLLRTALAPVGVRIADTSADGARVLLLGEPSAPSARVRGEAELRERALRAMRDGGLLDPDPGVEGEPTG